jgi:DNA-binding NtrC family response regulator
MPSRKILLLSDGSQIFSVLDRFFTEQGYQTITASSREGALKAGRAGDYRLLITRLQQNRQDALATLKAIRRRHPGVTAIILRGEHEVNSPIEAYQVHDNGESFIPCGWPGLRRLVASCLN